MVLLRVTSQLRGQWLFDVRVSGEDAPHRFDQHLRCRSLGQVTRSPGFQRLVS